METDEDRQTEGGCGHEEPHRADWKGRISDAPLHSPPSSAFNPCPQYHPVLLIPTHIKRPKCPPRYCKLRRKKGSNELDLRIFKVFPTLGMPQSHLTLRYPINGTPPGSSAHGISQATGMGCCLLLQGIFSTQGSNPHLLCLLHWRADS